MIKSAQSTGYYALDHPDPVSVLVAGRYPKYNGSVPVFGSVDSPPFAEKFSTMASRMNGELMLGGGDERPLGDIARKAMSGGEVTAREVFLHDLRGERRAFVAEAFFNRHNLFVMLTAKKAARFGIRIRAVAS